jgi:hypothetical protein
MAGTAYYAIKLLRSMRNGVLEKGWRFIVFAAFCLIFGILALDLSISGLIGNNLLLEILGYAGASLQAVGGLGIAYGFKAQYDAWNPKGMRKKELTVPEEVQ